MKNYRIIPIMIAALILILTVHATHSAQNKEIEILIKDIKLIKYHKQYLKDAKGKIESGEYYIIWDYESLWDYESQRLISKKDFFNKLDKREATGEITPLQVIDYIDQAKKMTKETYNYLLRRIKELDEEISNKERELAKLEKEESERFQKGRAHFEVKINREKFSRPSKDLLRWDWQFRFDEINGVGVTIKQCWTRGMRGSQVKENKREPMNLRIEPFGSGLLFTPYMQYGIKYDKKSPGTMKYIYTGIDDNGNKVKAKINITRYPK